MGIRRMAWIAALATGLGAIVIVTPVVVHAVVATADSARPGADVAVRAARTPAPAGPSSTVTSDVTTTTAPAQVPSVDLGATAGRLPAPTPILPARAGDRSSWVSYLGPVAPMDASEAEIAGALYAWINHERAAQGQAPLAWSADLAHSARYWSIEMVGYDASHSNFLGRLPERYARTAENVGTIVPGDGALIHKALAQSPRHLINMLDGRFDVVGIGVACTSGGRLYITQHFGARAPETAAEGRAPSWKGDVDAAVGPDGRRAPTRCAGSWPVGEDPPETPPEAPDETTTTTAPTTTSTSSSTSSSSTSSSTTTTEAQPTTTTTEAEPTTTTTEAQPTSTTTTTTTTA